jgi:hypothetical protein
VPGGQASRRATSSRRATRLDPPRRRRDLAVAGQEQPQQLAHPVVEVVALQGAGGTGTAAPGVETVEGGEATLPGRLTAGERRPAAQGGVIQAGRISAAGVDVQGCFALSLPAVLHHLRHLAEGVQRRQVEGAAGGNEQQAVFVAVAERLRQQAAVVLGWRPVQSLQPAGRSGRRHGDQGDAGSRGEEVEAGHEVLEGGGVCIEELADGLF